MIYYLLINLKLDSVPPVKGDSSKPITYRTVNVEYHNNELEQIDYDNMQNPQFTIAYVKEIFTHLRATEVLLF